MASTAEFASFRAVSVMISPQISMQPPAALMTAWVMFWLRDFSLPACVPQKPGVLQISETHSGGGGEIVVHCTVPVSHCWLVGHVVAWLVDAQTPRSQRG